MLAISSACFLVIHGKTTTQYNVTSSCAFWTKECAMAYIVECENVVLLWMCWKGLFRLRSHFHFNALEYRINILKGYDSKFLLMSSEIWEYMVFTIYIDMCSSIWVIHFDGNIPNKTLIKINIQLTSLDQSSLNDLKKYHDPSKL